MSQQELLSKVAGVLDRAGIPYMVTGSLVSSFQGAPRATHDIDLVVSIEPAAARSLADAFPPPDYYLDEQSIRGAIASGGQFNLLDVSEGDKVDFWMLTNEPFDQSRFARRVIADFNGTRLPISTPEDTILQKLKWATAGDYVSEKQFGDALRVYELQFRSLDLAYIEEWAARLRVEFIWERLKRGADPFS